MTPRPNGPDTEQEPVAAELRELHARQRGEPITLGNEFSDVRVSHVATRNGDRLLIECPKSGHWVALCPLEVEALTWQDAHTFSAMIAQPFSPLFTGTDTPTDGGPWS